MSYRILWVFCLTLVVTWSYADTTWHAYSDPNIEDNMSDEKRLVHSLLRGYRRVGLTGRPVRNGSTPILVHFGLGLIKMQVEEKDNMLSISAWTKYQWRDEYLTWDPGDFGNISAVKLPQDAIWMPDIMLYNTASTDLLERATLAVVDYNGTVSWFPHRIFHSSCSIDVRNFPFDNQTCHMWFGSWTHTSDEIDLTLAFPAGIDLSTFQADFKDGSKWMIERADAQRTNGEESGTGYSVLSFTLHMRRRMMFSSYILSFPVVFMSFLTLLVFWLPATSSDKSGLGLTIFGSLLLLLLILVEAAPPTASGVPILGLYYCFNIIIVILSIFLSSLVANIASSHTPGCKKKPVPRIIYLIFFRGIAPLLCQTRLREDVVFVRDHGYRKAPRRTTSDEHLKLVMNTIDKVRKSSTDTALSNNTHMHPQLLELCETFRLYMRERQREEEEQLNQKAVDAEWQYLGMLLDRIFMIIYLVVIILSIIFMFPR